ncbi:hypothetical protein [Bythopirellula polymerisocia]|uniref:DUF3352 domain-containing protein n=1 Tax=Bythopirellula polymerisocia TaxID=2528003 RepID=A0A5C6CR84_9BACT|nr:hypothetical protein [Bythopirellula polymerisocia]TWU26047.1 hypothetical protein Pla144_32640 [Bythopirellula polymerisocia]
MKDFISLLFVTMVLRGLPANAREPSLTTLVPANAIAYIAAPNLGQLDSGWTATGFADLWRSEGFADFRKTFYDASRLNPNSDLSLLGINWQQLLSVSSGEACWALVPLDDEVGFLLLVDVAEHAAQAAKLIAELRQKAPFRIYFLENGVLGITNRQELTKSPTEILASNEQFMAIAAHTHSTTAQLTWYVKPWAIQSIASRSGSNEEGKSWQQLADNGFEVVQAEGGAITLATDKHDVEHNCFIYSPGQKEKAARLLNFLPLKDESLPNWIPTEIDSVSSTQWNLAGALAGYGSYFDATYAEGIDGTFDAVLDDIHQETTGPQVDILALLEIQSGPVLRLTKTLQNGLTAVVYAVKVTDEAKMKDALLRMFGPDEEVEKKSRGQFKLWVFKDIQDDPDAGESMGPDLADYALTVAWNYFLVSTSESALEALLDANTTPRVVHDETEDPLESLLKDHSSENTISAHNSPSAAGLRPAFEGIRTRGSVDLGQLLGDPEDPQHLLDFSTLPESNTLPRFIASGFGFVNQSEDGWHLQDFVDKKVK